MAIVFSRSDWGKMGSKSFLPREVGVVYDKEKFKT